MTLWNVSFGWSFNKKSAGQFYADKFSHFVFKWVRLYALAEIIGPLVTFGDGGVENLIVNQLNKQSPTNMSKTEKLKVSCIPSLDLFLYDHIILGWPQRLFEFSYNIF